MCTKDTGTVDNTIVGFIPHCCFGCCIQMYKLRLTKEVSLDLQMFLFSELKKYFHKTEGKIEHAAVAHTNHTVIHQEQKPQTHLPTPYCIQTFQEAKLDSPRTYLSQLKIRGRRKTLEE